ncbi:MAG: hypothetical protein WC943_04670 [Elusimicrobiota bacterium]|jgi:Mg/Co/Ni transporter MgtE
MDPLARLPRLLERRDFSGLRHALQSCGPEDLAAWLPSRAPLEKLACFKLMRHETALALFRLLPFSERYFLVCGFPLQSLAPLLSELSGLQRALFHESPPALRDMMLDEMREKNPRGSLRAVVSR